MPTYQYQCKSCGHQLEELQSFSDPPLVRCPNCGNDTLARVLGGGGGLIFKGSGFYGTDYKKSGNSSEPLTKSDKKKEKQEEKKPESPTPPSPSTENKPSGESKTPPPKKD